MRPTQVTEIFGNVSTPSVDIQVKIYGNHFRGTLPASGKLNPRGVAEYSDFGPIGRYISLAFGTDYVKVVEDRPILFAAEIVLAMCHFMARAIKWGIPLSLAKI